MKIESFCRKWGLLFFLLIMFGCNSSSGGSDNPDGRDTQSPSKPEVVSAPEISAGRVALSWPAASDNVGVARYKIYRNGSMIADSGETSYIDTVLPDPGRYCYSVSALDEAGNESEQSQPACADVPPQPDTEPPSVPAGVSASLADSGVRITWSASTDNQAVAGYKIFRNGVKISDITETSFNDSSLSPGTRYCYTVSAFDASGNESAQSFESCTDSPAARDDQPPSVPANLRCSSSPTSNNLSWSASSDNVAVTGYKVFRNGSYIASVASTSYSDSGISGPDRNCYTILAFDAAGNESQKSDETCLDSVAGKTRWKVEMSDQIEPRMAMSPDGTLYLMTSKLELYAIGPDGSIKWKYAYEGEYISNSKYLPVIGIDGTVYWGVGKHFYAIKADGSLKWKADISGLSAYNTTPAIDKDGTIMVDAGFFYLFGSDGSLKKQIYNSNYWFSPIIGHDGTIYGQFEFYYPDGSPKGRNPGSGAPVALNQDGSYYSVLVSMGPFGGIVDSALVSMNSDYSEKWRINLSGQQQFYSPAVGADETVYAASSDGYLNAYSASGVIKWKKTVGLQLWSHYFNQDSFTPAIGSDGAVYIQTDTGLHALDGNGGELWANREAVGSSCPLIGSDGTIYVSSGNAVYAVYSDSRGLASSSWPRYRKNNENTGNGLKVVSDAPPPPGPSGITASAQSPSMIKLDWLASTGAINPVMGYKIYRNDRDIGFTFTNGYVDSGLSSSTSYCYTVVAVDFAGKESVGADVCASTPGEALVGELKWKYTYQVPCLWETPSLLGDGSVYAGGKYCIDSATGTLKWTLNTFVFSISASVAGDSSIYLGPYFCMNADGSTRWQKNPPMTYSGYHPAAIDPAGNLYADFDGSMRAFDSSGTEKWVFDTGIRNSMNMPAIASDSTLYQTPFISGGVLYAIKPDGNLKWKFDAALPREPGTDYFTSSASIGDDGTVYFVSESSSGDVLFAINPDGTKKWEFRASQDGQSISPESPVVNPEGVVYTGGDSLRALKNDGTLKWERKGEAPYSASTPVIGKDGVLYIFSDNGLEAINPDGSLKWLYPSVSRALGNCLIADDGTLYFDTGFVLYAVQTSSMGLATSGWPRRYHDNQNTGCMP